MRKKDIDLFVINEALASVVLRYQRAMELGPRRVNELERRGQSTALITLCAAAGRQRGDRRTGLKRVQRVRKCKHSN